MPDHAALSSVDSGAISPLTSDEEVLGRIASSPPRAFCGELVHEGRSGACLVPSPDTMGQPPRSWPPNTGCDPADQILLAVDLRGVASVAERVRSVVNGAVLAALASDGVSEISVEASYQLADRIAVRAAEELASALYRTRKEVLDRQAGKR